MGPSRSKPKDKAIIAAIITAFATIIGAVIGIARHNNPSRQFTGKVADATSSPIRDAEVLVELDQQAPQRYYSDSDGIFHIEFPADTKTMHIVVSKSDYATEERELAPNRTGQEKFLLRKLGETPVSGGKTEHETGPVKQLTKFSILEPTPPSASAAYLPDQMTSVRNTDGVREKPSDGSPPLSTPRTAITPPPGVFYGFTLPGRLSRIRLSANGFSTIALSRVYSDLDAAEHTVSEFSPTDTLRLFESLRFDQVPGHCQNGVVVTLHYELVSLISTGGGAKSGSSAADECIGNDQTEAEMHALDRAANDLMLKIQD